MHSLSAKLKLLIIFSLLKLPTMPKSRKNIIAGYYYGYVACVIRIIRCSNAAAVFMSPDFKNKTKEVNMELFK